MFNNTDGDGNTATGSLALFNNTNGNSNAANGFFALGSNTIGSGNTGNGSQALNFNTVGNENTASGNNALFNNTTGNDNTATGVLSLLHNTDGIFNTSNGASSLFSNVSGSFNTADGGFALFENTGSNNIALGYTAGTNLTTGSQNIDIGNQGVGGESSTIRIGTDGLHQATFIAGITSATVAGTAVLIDANGRLGTILSSRRFKEAVKPMGKSSEALLALKPVTFRYKPELDAGGTAQFGLIAEEVEKVNPALVTRDASGQIRSVRYEAVNAMLLNEFLKEHHQVEELQKMVTQQQKDFQAAADEQRKQVAALTAALQQQASQIQQVKTELRITKPAPQVVDNGR
jgi:hypothetical protein